MAFIDDIPNWESLSSDDFEMHKISSQLRKGVRILVTKCANQKPDEYCARLKGILHDFACTIETEVPVGCFPDDIEGEMWRIVNCIDTMPKLADCLDILCDWGLSRDKVNELLENHNIGYEYIDDCDRGTGWVVRDVNATPVEKLEETKSLMKTISSQAEEHIQQAIAGLKDIKDERARKNVVLNLVHGLESVVKTLANTDKKLDRAIEKIKKEEVEWGNNQIIEEGRYLFATLQKEYQDLRHGTNGENKSSMSKDEAIYWVERIACYMRYMSKTAKKLGRDRYAS